MFSPDPSPALGYWDRLSGGAVVRVGQAWQTALELPGAVTAKVGAGAAAAVLAGAAGGPAVVDALKGSRQDRVESQRAVRHVAAAVRRAVGPTASATAPARRPAAARPPAHPAVPLAQATLRRIAHVAALVGRSHRRVHPASTAPAPGVTRTVTAPATTATASAPSRTPRDAGGSSSDSVALEFGP